jgi:hypothetical protein
MTAFMAGTRERFDPAALRNLPCMVCGARIICIGVFCPSTDEARAAVLTLRTHALHIDIEPALAYGLCAGHMQWSLAQIEEVIFASAGRVSVQ